MRLTRTDAAAVHHTGRAVTFFNRGVITDVELVNALFDGAYVCETDDGIGQCIAVMPLRLWPLIEEKIAAMREQAHPGNSFWQHVADTHTEQQLAALDCRANHLVYVIANYLQHPTGKIEYEIDDPDGMRQQWFLFKHFETVAGEKCRRPACPEDRIQHGALCRAHHFEMIYGQPPPSAAEPSNKQQPS